jgi:hypothetical protein
MRLALAAIGLGFGVLAVLLFITRSWILALCIFVVGVPTYLWIRARQTSGRWPPARREG